jgi:hypothetical protein
MLAKLGRMKNIKTQVGRSFFSIVAVNKIWRGFSTGNYARNWN